MRSSRIDNEVAERIPCPVCKAPSRAPCRNNRGTTRKAGAHPERIAAARLALAGQESPK